MPELNSLCDVYHHRFINKKYDTSDIDLLTLIQNTTAEEFELLEQKTEFPLFIEYLRNLIFMHRDIENENLVQLTSLQLDNFINLYHLIKNLKEQSMITYALINGADHLKNTFFRNSLFPALMNNTKDSLNDTQTMILLDAALIVYYGLIQEHKKDSCSFIAKLHELNPNFFSYPVMSNQEFINHINSVGLLELDLYDTIEKLRIRENNLIINDDFEID